MLELAATYVDEADERDDEGQNPFYGAKDEPNEEA